jgi:hypothetical protein
MYSLLKTLNPNSPGAMDHHVGIENLTDCAFPHFRGCYLIAEMRGVLDANRDDTFAMSGAVICNGLRTEGEKPRNLRLKRTERATGVCRAQ